MLNILSRAENRKKTASALHAALVARARAPVFYAGLGVPDSVDGRFDLIALHAWLVLERLRAAGLNDLSQALMDTLFVGFDEGLRDLGAGDMGLGPRMKKLGNAFNGRCQAYEAASGSEAGLRDAILRNVYRGAAGHDAAATALARYALSARARLELCNPADGVLDFGPVPTTLP